MIDVLEQIQADSKYRLSPEQIDELVKSFSREYCCEVLIELGHDNQEIHQATGVNMARISWMRVKYQTPPKRGQLEFRYKEINVKRGFAHVTTEIERKFCQLFRCGIYHKDHKQLTARIDK